ncbi:MAG TPA: hypothetical protein VLH18_02180, partial [Candidatus Limnocylindrales bacterium]|nr:hypothetical protein [Candidatus Limnocylindrales bacterium]
GAGRRFRDVVEKTPVNEPEKIQVRPAEKILIALMLQSKGIAQKGRNLIQLEHIYDERVRNIMEAIWDMASSEVVISAEKLLNQFDDQQICNLISEAVTDPALQDLPPQTAKRMAEDCISQLRQVWSERQVRELQRKLKEMEDQGLDEQTTELLREHQSSLREKESSAYRSGKGEDLNG